MPLITPDIGSYKDAVASGKMSKQEWYRIYTPWIIAMYNSGFWIDLNCITNMLRVTPRYLHKTLNTEVDYINAHAAVIAQQLYRGKVGIKVPLVYYHEDQFVAWLCRHCVCTRQTRLVDFTALCPSATLSDYRNFCRDNKDKDVSDYLAMYGYRSQAGIIVSKYDVRSSIPHIPVDFDSRWLMSAYGENLNNLSNIPKTTMGAGDVKLHYPKYTPRSTETFYRQMLADGAIRISIDGGTSKVIYVTDMVLPDSHVGVTLLANDYLVPN